MDHSDHEADAQRCDRIEDVWGARTPQPRGTARPTRVDLHLEDDLTDAQFEQWVQSACLLCSNGCGCDIVVKDGRMVGVRARVTGSVNHDRLGPKGLYRSTPWASSPDRLIQPMVIEHCDAVFFYGHNMPETQTVLWARILDRTREIIENGWVDHDYVPRIFGESEAVLSTVQNNHECGADGDLAGFRNSDNPRHVHHTSLMLAEWSEEHRRKLAPAVERYGEDQDVDEPERLHSAGLAEAREGEVELLRDLQDLHVLATLVQTTWTVIAQGAQGLRDPELLEIAESCNAETSRAVLAQHPDEGRGAPSFHRRTVSGRDDCGAGRASLEPHPNMLTAVTPREAA